MPEAKYNNIFDHDFGEIIAYLKTLPAVDNELDESKLNPLGRIISVFRGNLIPASIIDTQLRACQHQKPESQPQTEGTQPGSARCVMAMIYSERLFPVTKTDPKPPTLPVAALPEIGLCPNAEQRYAAATLQMGFCWARNLCRGIGSIR